MGFPPSFYRNRLAQFYGNPLEMPEDELNEYVRPIEEIRGVAPTEPQGPGLLDQASSALHTGLGYTLGAPKRAVDIAANYYAGGQFRRDALAGEPASAGELVREALLPEQEAKDSYLQSAARAGVGFVTDIATDPLSYLLPAGGKVGRAAAAAFAPSMALGTVQGAQQTAQTIGEEGFTPRALESALETAASGAFAIGAGRHALRGHAPRTIQEAVAQRQPETSAQVPQVPTLRRPPFVDDLAPVPEWPEAPLGYTRQGVPFIPPTYEVPPEFARRPVAPEPLQAPIPDQPPTLPVPEQIVAPEPILEAPQGEQTAKVPSRLAYRVRNVGEEGIPSTGHAQASLSEAEVRRLAASRTDAPQEVVSHDLSGIKEGEEFVIQPGPNGAGWVTYRKPVEESALTNLGPITKLDIDAASKAEPPLRDAVAAAPADQLSSLTGLDSASVEKGRQDVRDDGLKEFSPEAVAVKRAVLQQGQHSEKLTPVSTSTNIETAPSEIPGVPETGTSAPKKGTTFADFVRSKGVSWPIKATHPDYPRLLSEFGALRGETTAPISATKAKRPIRPIPPEKLAPARKLEIRPVGSTSKYGVYDGARRLSVHANPEEAMAAQRRYEAGAVPPKREMPPRPGSFPKDEQGQGIYPGEESLSPEQRRLLTETVKARAMQLAAEERAEPTGARPTAGGYIGSRSKKTGTPLEDVNAGPEAMLDAANRDKGNVLEREMRAELLRKDSELADAMDDLHPKFSLRPSPGQSPKPPWEMTGDELDAAHASAKEREAGLDRQILGADFDRYNKAQRVANSMFASKEKQAEADATIAEIEGRLSEQARNQLFGIGDENVPAEVYGAYRDKIRRLDPSSPEDLGASLRWAITDVGRNPDPRQMSEKQAIAYAQIREARRIAQEQGWDPAVVGQAALRASAARFSDPADAAFMLGHYFRGKEPAPKQIEGPKFALKPSPGQRGLEGIAEDVAPKEKERKHAPEQEDLFGKGAMLQGVAPHVTEGRETEGPLFTQERDVAVKADASRQATFPSSPAEPKSAVGATVSEKAGEKGTPKFATKPTGKIDPDRLPREVLARMDQRLRAMDYDSRGADDVLAMLKSGRVFKDGQFTQEDWQAAYDAATGSRQQRQAKATSLKEQTPHVNWEKVRGFGTTSDPRRAGYVRPDGHLMDMAGPGESVRGEDHRIVGGTRGMQELKGAGYIRWMPEANGLDIAKEPTTQQYAQIRKLAERANGEVILDLQEGLGTYDPRNEYYSEGPRKTYLEYPEGTKPERIVGDIRRFFAGEDLPQGQRFAAQEKNLSQAEPLLKEPAESFNSRQALRDRLVKTFSSLRVQQVGEGYVLPTPSGKRILVTPKSEIIFDPQLLEKGHGAKAAEALREGKLQIAGATYRLGKDVAIEIADGKALPHESLHVFLDHFASSSERKLIRSKFEQQAKEEGRAWDETAGDEYVKWFDKPESKTPIGKFFTRVRDYFLKLKDALFPSAEGVFRAVKSGEPFTRTSVERGGGAGRAATRREHALLGKRVAEGEVAAPPYERQRYPFEQAVRVVFPDGDVHYDKIKGLNRGHAIARAEANWDEAKIEALTNDEYDFARGVEDAVRNAKNEARPGRYVDGSRREDYPKFATAPKQPPLPGAALPFRPKPKEVSQVDQLGKRAAENAKEADRIASKFEALNDKFRIGQEGAQRVEERGTIEKAERPAFREAGQPDAQDTKGFRFSSEDIQRSGRQMVDAVKSFRSAELEFRQKADPVSAEAMKFARQSMERAIKQWQVYRSAAGRAVKTFDRPIPADVIQSLREAGNLARVKEIKERVPITTNIINSLKNWKNLTDAEKEQFRRDLVDQYRLNLFSTTSFTLDLVGNATELAGQTAGGLARDLVRVSRGDVSFPSMQGMLRAIRHARDPLPPEVAQAFQRTVSGEPLRQKGGTFTYRSNLPSKVYDYMVGLPLYLKGGVDSGAKKFGAMATLYRDALEVAHKRGATGLARQELIDRLVNHPTEEMAARAIANGQKAGFDRPLSMTEEKFASSTATRLLVSPFARWPFQFTRWAGEMLGYNREILSKMAKGQASREEVAHYLAKTATGWGGLYLLNKTLYDRTDFNSMEYVDEDGNRVRLSNRDPIPSALWLLAVIKGDAAKAAKGLQFASIPGGALLSGEGGGLLTGLLQNGRRAMENVQSDPRALKRELDDTINRAIPGQAVLSFIETLIDPKIREGVGANIPGVSLTKDAAIDPVTGEDLEPRQSIGGVEFPSIGGTPVPGATRLLNPVQKLLSRYGMVVYRGPKQPIAGYPPGEVPEDMRREWTEAFGQARQKLLGPLARAMGVLEKKDPEQVRKAIQQRDSQAARYADSVLRKKYGGPRKLARQPTMRELARPSIYQGTD